MKRLTTIMMCLLAMMAASLSAKAQEVTITLFPGWNWISYPKAEVLDINTALGDFVPVDGDMLKSQFGNAVYSNGYWRGSVTHFIPGWGYKYYSNRTEVVSFVFGEAAPQITVTTAEPTEITAISASCGGSVISIGGSFVMMKGVCWATHQNPNANDDFHSENGSGTGSFSVAMTDLIPNTEYYVRAYAVSANGITYGEQKSIITGNGIPVVITDSVTNILMYSATCSGTVISDGGLDVISKGMCWGTSPSPTINDSYLDVGVGLGNFLVSITGLTIGTTYYVRAYASTSLGIGYGEEVSFTTSNGIPLVTTASVTGIEGTYATCGGVVVDDCGLNVMDRGVCWSISPNPTISDNHTSDGSGLGVFNSFMTGLTIGTTYYVRAYATTNQGTGYGEELNFFTTIEHFYVDLGLPSGLLWATCNVGADTPEEYGDHFAWGEIQPKSVYNWSTYKYCKGIIRTLTKYCTNQSYGYNGFFDNLTTLLPEDDAATANWGVDWRMPLQTEWQELYQNTVVTWTTQNGVNGTLFTASNGNSLFLPAAGCSGNSSLYGTDSDGYYWSSSLYTGYLNSSDSAYGFYFHSDYYGMQNNFYRYYGHAVRAVRSAQ